MGNYSIYHKWDRIHSDALRVDNYHIFEKLNRLFGKQTGEQGVDKVE